MAVVVIILVVVFAIVTMLAIRVVRTGEVTVERSLVELERIFFVGFWPWPRVWTSLEAEQCAKMLPTKNRQLIRGLTANEVEIFRRSVVQHKGVDFEAHLCADGLITYRHKRHEAAIADGLRRAKDDITAGFPASQAAWEHYIAALSILFLLLESQLHIGRSIKVYWIEPISRTDIVRVRYDENLVSLGLTFYGPPTDMAKFRFEGVDAIGAQVNELFMPEIEAAFKEAMVAFEVAHQNDDLWGFLDVYSAAWAVYSVGNHAAAVMLSWSLLERDLVSQVQNLLQRIPQGPVMKLAPGGSTPQALSTGEETKLRQKIGHGESPMAGLLLGVLQGHGQAISAELKTAKDARDRLAHGGQGVQQHEAEAGLREARRIAKDKFAIILAADLGGNAHLGL